MSRLAEASTKATAAVSMMSCHSWAASLVTSNDRRMTP
jgi:hypothetical protein